MELISDNQSINHKELHRIANHFINAFGKCKTSHEHHLSRFAHIILEKFERKVRLIPFNFEKKKRNRTFLNNLLNLQKYS